MKRPKQRPPDTKDIKSKHIMTTIKTSLKSILGYNPNDINDLSYKQKDDRIQNAVYRVNNIVFHTTHFLELYLLHIFHNNLPKPIIDLNFIGLCMRTVAIMPPQGKRSGGRPKQTTLDIMNVLKKFYVEHYEPLLGSVNRKVNLLHLVQSLQYEEIDILKNIKTNITKHFLDYCKELVNKTFGLKDVLEEVNSLDISSEQKKLTKRNISIQMRLVKEDLISPKDTPYTSNEKYHSWLNDTKPHIITKQTLDKNSIHYDIKSNTLDYLFSMIYVIGRLQTYGRKISFFPVRSSFGPKYITFDTTSVISIMIDDYADSYCRKIKESKEIIWTTFFNIKTIKRKDYNFFSMIRTDGVGVSILYYRSDQNQDKLPKDIVCNKEYYVDEMEVEPLGKMKVVGIDPGKDDLIHCTDGDNFFRYTANQRRMETKKKKYMNINEEYKEKTVIEGLTIKQWEATLSSENSHTTDLIELKKYLAVKLPLYTKLEEYYYDPLRRILRWYSYINTQKSEAKMINNFKAKFGTDVIITIGDYDQGSYHMKHKEPTKGKGLRKVFKQAGYQVLLVDEFRTSCKCFECHGDTEKWLRRKNCKPIRNKETHQETILVHGLLRCKSVNECGRLWNRDVNGCLNIRMLAMEALLGRERPQAFRRGETTKNSCELYGSL